MKQIRKADKQTRNTDPPICPDHITTSRRFESACRRLVGERQAVVALTGFEPVFEP
jgi:hypothetical protein